MSNSLPPLNVGIVGLGKMGILHAGIINALPRRHIAAICEKEGVIVRAAKKILPRIPFYDDIENMISEENLEAIVITSPIHTHVPIIEIVLSSGAKLGIFVEKPLAAFADEAARISQKVSTTSLVNMVGFQKRFSPVFRHAKNLLERGAIGDIQFFKGTGFVSDIFHQGEGWRFSKGSGGALLDLGPHLIDLMIWYFGDVKPIAAVKRSVYSKEVDDYVQAILETSSGAVGSFEVCWSIRNYRIPEFMVEAHGTNGMLRVTDDYVRVYVDKSVDGVAPAGGLLIKKAAFDTNVSFLLADPEFTLEDEHFLGAVERKSKAEPDFVASAKVNRVVEAIRHEASVL